MKPLMERYVDKEHAVGIIWCLELHFKRISERLDKHGVPTEWIDKDGQRKKLCVESRIALLLRCAPTVHLNDELISFEVADIENDKGVDPEDILDIINGRTNDT